MGRPWGALEKHTARAPWTTEPGGARILAFSGSTCSFKVPPRFRTPMGFQHTRAVWSWSRFIPLELTKSWHPRTGTHSQYGVLLLQIMLRATSTQGLAIPHGQESRHGLGEAALSMGYACRLPAMCSPTPPQISPSKVSQSHEL